MTEVQSEPDELPDLTPAEERAAKVLEEQGGLPDDNPFSDVVETLHDAGESWWEIWQIMDEVYDVVDSVAFEENTEEQYEWDVEVDPMPHDKMIDTKTHTELADSEEEAQEQTDTPGEAEIVDVEFAGVARY